MLYTVVLFGLLGRVPAFETASEVARDTSKTCDAIARADGAFVVDDASIAARLTGVNGVVDGAVANTRVLHRLDELEDDRDVLLRFSIQLDVADMSAEGDGVEGSFATNLVVHPDFLTYIDVEGVDVVIQIVDAWDGAIALAVHTSEASRESFGGRGKDGVVEVVFLLVFSGDFVHHFYGFVKGLP